MHSFLKIVTSKVLLPFSIMTILTFSVSGCRQRIPLLFLLPADFQGFAFLEHSRSGCRPLQAEKGFFVIEIDVGGKACTSSNLEVGYSRRDEFLVGERILRLTRPGDTTTGPVVYGFWSGVYQTETGKHSYMCFYVGSVEEFSRLKGDKCVPEELIEYGRRLEAEAMAESPD